jgi:3-methyladenine DNA glycosylase AlkD
VTRLEDAKVRRLQAALEARATEKSRTFWQRYLRGSAVFRGVAMADVRKTTKAWWTAEGIDEMTVPRQIDVALRLFEETPSEDRLAGVLALSERLLPHLTEQHLPAFARLFEGERIADWNLCDWFCVKVLGGMLDEAEDPKALAEAIAAWRTSGPLWQRRAACVAFVNHAKHGDERIAGLSDIILASADALVRDPERFAQTGVGWVLRELSIARPDAVVAFAEKHAARLSREAMKSLARKLPADARRHLLVLHAEAGTA